MLDPARPCLPASPYKCASGGARTLSTQCSAVARANKDNCDHNAIGVFVIEIYEAGQNYGGVLGNAASYSAFLCILKKNYAFEMMW
ncbi:BICD family-like cargo adapter 2 [Frankliniella fusca]|uniref:BICD family-like cargo adapter 2 n=1 Tax=Frankliniella fusca TaxID=407009 RepID=A0AAE1GWA6_9NEOP|nr:BICD family-like cargo adapter 2 [Frankliniella fusca]